MEQDQNCDVSTLLASITGMSGTLCFLPFNVAPTNEVSPSVSTSTINERLFDSSFRVCSTSYPRSPSHCVNRIITIHFLEGQISCRPRVCMELPFPIDNHVCSSVGFTAQSSVNTTIPASHPLRPAPTQPWHTWGPGYTGRLANSVVLPNDFAIVKNAIGGLRFSRLPVFG
jgi:hypothetical protein